MQYKIAATYRTLLESYNIAFNFEHLLDLDWIDKTEGYLLFKKHSPQKDIKFIAWCCLLITKSNYGLTSSPTGFSETRQRIRQDPLYVRFGSSLMECSRGNKPFGQLIEETI